jgi:hypothetical protein
MQSIAIFLAIFVSIFVTFVAIFLLPIISGKAEREKARARRIAEAKMNARLLRLNL